MLFQILRVQAGELVPVGQEPSRGGIQGGKGVKEACPIELFLLSKLRGDTHIAEGGRLLVQLADSIFSAILSSATAVSGTCTRRPSAPS